MKKINHLLVSAVFILLPIASGAQTEAPRGIYKMMSMTGRNGEIRDVFDWYKICTDSVTLMLDVKNDASFQIRDNDHTVLTYTGDTHQDANDKSMLIYNSNANHFTLKWWNANQNHRYCPENTWCIEKYEANKYSNIGRIVLEALTSEKFADRDNQLLGTWRILGDLDEMRDAKRVLPMMQEKYVTSKYFNSFLAFTPQSFVIVYCRNLDSVTGNVFPVMYEYDAKKSYKWLMKMLHAKWLSKDCIAVKFNDSQTYWTILARVSDNQTMLSRIAGLYVASNM